MAWQPGVVRLELSRARRAHLGHAAVSVERFTRPSGTRAVGFGNGISESCLTVPAMPSIPRRARTTHHPFRVRNPNSRCRLPRRR